MKRTIVNGFTAILAFIIIMISSCREPLDNANPSGEGINQEWDDGDANRGNDSIKDENNQNKPIRLHT